MSMVQTEKQSLCQELRDRWYPVGNWCFAILLLLMYLMLRKEMGTPSEMPSVIDSNVIDVVLQGGAIICAIAGSIIFVAVSFKCSGWIGLFVIPFEGVRLGHYSAYLYILPVIGLCELLILISA